MSGPISLDPSRIAEARQAYEADLRYRKPELTDNNGNSKAGNPIISDGDGNAYFNSWIANDNERSAQDTHVTVSSFDHKGKPTTERVAAWKEVPQYYSTEAQKQSGGILERLNNLQGKGFENMQRIYKDAMGKVA